MLLRVSRSSPSWLAPRAVATAAPSLHPAQPDLPTPGPRDEGDHDPDIDLITLRRRSRNDHSSGKTSTGANHEHRESDTAAAPSHPPRSASSPIANGLPLPAMPELHKTETRTSKLQSHLDGLAKALNDSAPRNPKSTAESETGKFTKQRDDIRAIHAARNDGVLDPYLVSYLKSLQSNSSRLHKGRDSHDAKHSQQDLDIDTLRPSDIRATYTTRKRKLHSEMEAVDTKPVIHVSGEPAAVPEHLIHAGLQHLNLTTSGGKVVIPRTMLVRLIEQTINLSGAAVSGDDVVIERYSPTWHRFARLLRTSDLHKISTLKPSDTLSSKHPPETTPELLKEATEGPMPSTDTNPSNIIKPHSVHDALQATPEFTEREYVVLALDAKKKRVVSTRFRRLLDGSSNISPPSSESFLKVESLHRYVSIMKRDPQTIDIYPI